MSSNTVNDSVSRLLDWPPLTVGECLHDAPNVLKRRLTELRHLELTHWPLYL